MNPGKYFQSSVIFLVGWFLLGTMVNSPLGSQEENLERQNIYYHSTIDGPINPVSADYLNRVIQQAEDDRVQGIIIELDTPGGLMSSMNRMTDRILRAKVPVIVWVPRGGDATSAGAFILLSSHVASMGSATTVGSATPVQMGGTPPGDSESSGSDQSEEAQTGQSDSKKKAIEWASTKIRQLAAQQNRNQDLAEQFVREGISVGGDEALERGIIEFQADTLEELTRDLTGRSVELITGETVQFDEPGEVRELAMNWQEDFLKSLTDPQLLMILFSLGFMAIIYEVSNPGVGVGAVLGGIFLLLGFFGLGMMPINYAGLALVFLGLILMVLDIFIPTFGVLTIGGAVSFLLGGVMLFETEAFAVPLGLMIGVTSGMVTFALIMMWLVGKTFTGKVQIGDDSMIGRAGVVKEDLDPEGMVYVWGEYWDAESADGSVLRKDDRVKVVKKHDRYLTVEKHDPESTSTEEEESKSEESTN